LTHSFIHIQNPSSFVETVGNQDVMACNKNITETFTTVSWSTSFFSLVRRREVGRRVR